ncbi:MAG: acyltransferase [Alphaproteobacteria bacterium]|nr:acyltransferase [Alphaproteobacteria bacterium]
MAFLTEEQIKEIGFKSYGKNLKISDKAVFYRPERISLGNNVQIDDFCTVGNHVEIHNNVHLSVYCSVLSTDGALITFEDFSGLAPRCTVFVNTDDYSGQYMTNATIPLKFVKHEPKSITIGRHSIVGAGSMVFPGANIAEGTSVGAMSLVMKPTLPWKVYFGIPARPIMDRSKHILELEQQYLEENNG